MNQQMVNRNKYLSKIKKGKNPYEKFKKIFKNLEEINPISKKSRKDFTINPQNIYKEKDLNFLEENKSIKNLKENISINSKNNYQTNTIFDQSLLSDIKKGINNENLSTISKYFKKDKTNKFSSNNNIINEKEKIEENFEKEKKEENIDNEGLEIINDEIKSMLDKVVGYKTNGHNKFKINKVDEAMKDYLNVRKLLDIFYLFFIFFYPFFFYRLLHFLKFFLFLKI